jgi:hypothetical protein
VLPGLVEAHTHVLSSRYGIEEFVRHAIPCGVTTVITEASEFYVIVGSDGLDYVLKGFEKQRPTPTAIDSDPDADRSSALLRGPVKLQCRSCQSGCWIP